jgi:hypothetical protein
MQFTLPQTGQRERERERERKIERERERARERERERHRICKQNKAIVYVCSPDWSTK